LLRMAIVADDLTGALDVCAPLAAQGLRCRVAVNPQGLDEAKHFFDGEVLCINTATRELDMAAAGSIVSNIARKLAELSPSMVMKKIDSRLKGHVAIEAAACMSAFRKTHAILAPAIPRQDRFVSGGRVIGRGVTEPIIIAERIGDAFPYEAPDCFCESDLQRIVDQNLKTILLVGASGLTHVLARILTPSRIEKHSSFARPLLIVIGSRDPITLAQVEHARSNAVVKYFATADGDIDRQTCLPSDECSAVIVQATITGGATERTPAMVRFGASVADLIQHGNFGAVLFSGGETAQTVLREMGVLALDVVGEILTGIPVAVANVGDRKISILTKSGGFGTPEDILRLVEIAGKNTWTPSTVFSENECDGFQANN
jgi:D-threonate/D-erythronate kinase